MDIRDAIANRRSIRRFKPDPVPRELLEQLLEAATLAPSGKNRQPWSFVVVQGEKRLEMVRVMRGGMEKVRGAGGDLGSSEGTANCMEQAPATVFILNPHRPMGDSPDEWFTGDVVDVQSIGAAIENLLLAAEGLGLGTLWICDVFYAYPELLAWLGRSEQMIAAVSVGYADEKPEARPRKPWQEITTWLE
jgi:nitroreductase